MRAAILALTFIAIMFALAGSVHAQEGEMAVDCEGNSVRAETECRFGDGQVFTVSVHIVSPPAGGYVAFEAKLGWDGSVVDYLPDRAAQEALWPRCNLPARRDSRELRADDTSVLFGCIPFPLEEGGSDVSFIDTGPVLLFTFVCKEAGTSALDLMGSAGDPETHFVDPETQEFISPSVAGANVTCGGDRVTRPALEELRPGPSVEATATAEADGTSEATRQDETPGPTARSTVDEETPTANGGDGSEGDEGPWFWLAAGGAVALGVAGLGLLALKRRL